MIYRLFENYDYSRPEKTSDKKTLNKLNDALNSLSPHSREVLVLWGIEEYTPAEIAKMLGISRKAVYNRLDRAKKKLKRILEIV